MPYVNVENLPRPTINFTVDGLPVVEVILGVRHKYITQFNCLLKEKLPAGKYAKIHFKYHLPNSTMKLMWTLEGNYLDDVISVGIPYGFLQNVSDEALADLMLYAKQVLLCDRVVICFSRMRPDWALLIVRFMYMGCFEVQAWSPLVPFPDHRNTHLVYPMHLVSE